MSNGQIGVVSGSTFDRSVNFPAARAAEPLVEWKDFHDPNLAAPGPAVSRTNDGVVRHHSQCR
jgi:hypothetical protein